MSRERSLRRSWQMACLVLLLPLLVVLPAGGRASAVQPPVETGQFIESELDDWLQGTLDGVYVEGSELRLQEGATAGVYESRPLQAPFGLNAAVLEWHANVTAGQTLILELRSSVDALAWTEWQPARARPGSGVRSVSQLFVLYPFTSWLQYRVRFESSAGSPTLADTTLRYINSTSGPALVDIVARVPAVGPPTLTPAPPTVAGVDWGAQSLGRDIVRQEPAAVVLSAVAAPADDPNPAATLRALQWVDLNVEGLAALPYHFLVDGSGTIFQGMGSPTARLLGATDSILVALLAHAETEGVSEAALASVARLGGWLADAFDLPPAAFDVAADSPEQLRVRVPELRAAVDRAVVRQQMYFAAGSTALGSERLSLYNAGSDEARASLTVLSPLAPERRSVAVPPGQRVDVLLNSVFPINGPLGLEVATDRPLDVERTQIAGRELLGGTPITRTARVWYFATGSSADGDTTTLDLLNPQERDVTASVVILPDAGDVVTHTLTLAARSRQTVALNDVLPDQRFALKVVAGEPVAAERTAIMATGAAYFAPGVAAPSRRWLFAEGSTLPGYATTLALFNPWPQSIVVSLRILSEDGTTLTRRYTIPAQRRRTVSLNDIVPDLPFAMEVQADRPVAAERLMTFDDGQGAMAGPGATSPATRWTFVEGSTAIPADEYILVVNPHRQPVGLDVAYVLAGGQIERRRHEVGALSRLTLSANAELPDQPILTAILTSDRPVVAERTIYANGVAGRGGETTLGIPAD